MLNDLLDVLRDNGWSDTGPDHDAVQWLKEYMADCEGLQKAADDAEDARATAERDHDNVASELATLKEEMARLSK